MLANFFFNLILFCIDCLKLGVENVGVALAPIKNYAVLLNGLLTL
jgi:hypothetical protein